MYVLYQININNCIRIRIDIYIYIYYLYMFIYIYLHRVYEYLDMQMKSLHDICIHVIDTPSNPLVLCSLKYQERSQILNALKPNAQSV